ncbi:hypothetical protein CK203_060119 [Vitis vinifera]|uniref:Integrase catalytic domain-containing protein n=1 Tax=Vitis vinifera TaxID=29760 RepID=A0A438GGH9_VITVI|nr:hypothetical protein CK203_060119 [Vitis vinifera]
MLEDDVRAATQQVLVTNHITKDNKEGTSKPSNQSSVCPIDDTITFSPIDPNRVLQPHEDALVLTLGMDYSPSALKNPRRLLFEFNGAMTTSQSDIVLPIQVGLVTLNMVSYLTEEGQVDSLGNQLVARQCYQVALDSEHPADDEAHPKSSNTRKQYSLLTHDELELLGSVFKQNKGIFAWTHSDMSRIHPSMASHKLNVMPFLHPIRQKNGADYSSLKKCHSEAPPILPSSSSDHTHKPATPSYPAQIGSIQMNVEMGHQVEVSRSEVGLILQSPTRELMEQAICLNFFAANNEVEYEVVLVRLDLDLVLAATKLEIRSDYQLIVKQIQREYEVPREENEKTNVLTEIATTLLIKEVVTLPIYLKAAPSITPELVSNTSQMDSGWMLNIVKYFQTGKWGMDIVRPLPIAAAQKDFLPVAIDYFNKWVEAKAYASIKDKDVSKFIRKNIICRFGVPRVIVTDNGP